jgi:hypothetical protein
MNRVMKRTIKNVFLTITFILGIVMILGLLLYVATVSLATSGIIAGLIILAIVVFIAYEEARDSLLEEWLRKWEHSNHE